MFLFSSFFNKEVFRKFYLLIVFLFAGFTNLYAHTVEGETILYFNDWSLAPKEGVLVELYQGSSKLDETTSGDGGYYYLDTLLSSGSYKVLGTYTDEEDNYWEGETYFDMPHSGDVDIILHHIGRKIPKKLTNKK